MAGYHVRSHTYKQVDGLSLEIDVLPPPHPPNPDTSKDNVAVIHFHGGYLILGGKTTTPPHWLITACHARNWTYCSASYRLLPESSGLDILSDALDAMNWVRENVSSRIIIAGSSAGGFLAIAAVAHPECARPLGVLSLYGMVDLSEKRYVMPGIPLKGPVGNMKGVVGEVEDAMNSGKVIDGYPFLTNPPTDKRFGWIKAVHEAAIMPDILTRVPCLAERILEKGVDAIPSEHRVLFPLSFGLKKGFPPVILVHGDQDDLVGIEQSEIAFKKMKEIGIDVALEVAKGQGHGFEHMGYIDLEMGVFGGLDGETVDVLRRVVARLEKLCTR